MEEKENVYAENASAEQVAEAKKDLGSTALGKFKSVDALARAYESLQSEFTRRSQRLKELEREVENFSANNGRETTDGVHLNVEKRKENANVRRAEERKFDDFVSELESANACATSEQEKPTERVEQTLASDDAFVAEKSLEAESHCDVIPPVAEGDALYELASRDERVRLKIVGEYLSSLGKSGAPLMKGGGGALATPPLKPRSINEAGTMALRFFKNGGVQA